MRTIALTKGYETIVDDEDYPFASSRKWQALVKDSGKIYAQNGATGQYLHRVLLNAPKGMQVDHINGNSLDNRRINLRLCTQKQNKQNKSRSRSKYGLYKGVTWIPKRNMWLAQIQVDGRNISLGAYQAEREAALAYDRAARKYFGQFAKCNLPIEENDTIYLMPVPNKIPGRVHLWAERCGSRFIIKMYENGKNRYLASGKTFQIACARANYKL